MLKAFYSKKEEIPEGLEALYVEEGGKFVLKVEGMVEKSKLDEFRDSNLELTRTKEGLTNDLLKYKDVDIDKYNEAVEKLQAISDKKLIDEGKFNEVLEAQTERMRADYDNKLTAQTKIADDSIVANKALKGQLTKITIDNNVQLEASKIGKVQEGAMPDIVSRARSVFSMDDNGSVVALDENGGTKLGKDGKTPLTITEWCEGLLGEAPFLFGENAGSGASGGAGGGAGGKTISANKELSSGDIENLASGKVAISR